MKEMLMKKFQKVANETGLALYLPDYHGKDNDKLTVLWYLPEDKAENAKLEAQGVTGNDQMRPYVASTECADRNGSLCLQMVALRPANGAGIPTYIGIGRDMDELTKALDELAEKVRDRKMLDRIAGAAEDNGWAVTIEQDQDGDYEMELEQGSPAGEDFCITVTGEDAKEVRDAIRDYADTFDRDEHVRMWATASCSGVPDMETLVQDAKDIQEMLRTLADTVDELDI